MTNPLENHEATEFEITQELLTDADEEATLNEEI